MKMESTYCHWLCLLIVAGICLPSSAVTNLTLLTYNVFGRHVTDWTTNSTQVQAIGRQLSYLKPDVVGFQEIPEVNSGYLQMNSFIAAYLPGYYLAFGSYADGVERSVVASRFPIARSKSWLIGANLTPYGYSGKSARDLFEVQITVPGFDQPFHFFTAHLQAGTTQDEATRRGAEARCISNYFAAIYLTTNSAHPYCLVGDMNEDIYRPRDYELQAIQTLTSSPTGLQLTTPRNPFTSDERSWSIRNANLTIRFDYLLPCMMLYTNIRASQVFRSDRVAAPPMLSSDSATSSDHLPVMLTVRNPHMPKFDQTFDFGPLTNRTYADSPFDVSATASSGLPVSFSIQYGPATISGNTVTLTGIGTVSIRASQAGDFDYNAAPVVNQPFTVSKANQVITFGPLTNKTYGDGPFEVSASASSGLPVSFNIQSGPASINGNTVTITGAGTVTVRATQGGNTYYNAATPVSQTFTVAKASQTITFGGLADKTYGDSPFDVSASASSGLPVSFSILAGPATIDGNTVTIIGVGSVTVRATQAGNANYSAASPVDQSFTVTNSLVGLTITNSGNGEISLGLAGIPGHDYVLERSSNLVNWTQLLTNTAPTNEPDAGRIEYTETAPNNPAYYRAWQP